MIDQAKYNEERTEPVRPGSLGEPEAGAQKYATTLEVLVVHEDMPTGLRAKQVLDRLSKEPDVNLHFVVKLWTFKSLQDLVLHQHAVKDASDVFILFLSLHGHTELPIHVCELVDQWIAAREGPGALVVSLDKSLRDAPSTRSILEGLRTKVLFGEVDLFPHFGVAPSSAWHWGSAEPVVEAGGKPAPFVAPLLRETLGCNP